MVSFARYANKTVSYKDAGTKPTNLSLIQLFAQDRTTTLYPTEIMFALVALVVLLIIGRVMGELEWSGIGIVLLIVVVAAAIVSATGLHPVLMTAVYALIDVGLILKIFKGDLRTF